MQDTAEQGPGQPIEEKPERVVTLRAALVGLLGVVLISSIAPFNDYVMRNTPVIGSFLPLGLLMWILLMVLGVNAPLRRFAPRWALGRGELVVVTIMVLVACSMPTVGLMRYLPGHLVSFFEHAGSDPSSRQLMQQLDLPDWLFPTMDPGDPQERAIDPVVRGFLYGTNREHDGIAGAFDAVPWRAWLTPAITWGGWLVLMFGTLLALMAIFRHQWVENERLPFPLAQVYLSLLEPPEEGRAFNALFRSPVFWIAAASVFSLHAINGLHGYFPKTFPEIPTSYNFHGVFAEGPLRFIQWEAKQQKVIFVIIGVCFFLRTQLSFSLWFFFVLSQLVRINVAEAGGEFTGGMEVDQQLGAVVALLAVTLWIARHHLRMVVGQMFRAPRDGEPVGRYLPYRLAGWMVVLGWIGQLVWLTAAGMSFVAAALMVAMMTMVFLVLARVVAESGMPYVLLPIEFHRPWVMLLQDLPGKLSFRTTLHSYFFTNWFHGMFTHDTRENFAPYASHALRVADSVTASRPRGSRPAWGIVGCLVLALVVGYVVSGSSYLLATYNNPISLDRTQEAPINEWGARRMAREFAIDRTVAYVPPRDGPSETHSRPLHVALGAGITASLGFLRLNYVNWPLHPLGFLLVYTWGLKHTVFSIFLGWMCKALAARLGGNELLTTLRPVFIGLIIGEVAASAFWLVVAVLMVASGNEFIPIQFTPAT
jgi:hypothetical protein